MLLSLLLCDSDNSCSIYYIILMFVSVKSKTICICMDYIIFIIVLCGIDFGIVFNIVFILLVLHTFCLFYRMLSICF